MRAFKVAGGGRKTREGLVELDEGERDAPNASARREVGPADATRRTPTPPPAPRSTHAVSSSRTADELALTAAPTRLAWRRDDGTLFNSVTALPPRAPRADLLPRTPPATRSEAARPAQHRSLDEADLARSRCSGESVRRRRVAHQRGTRGGRDQPRESPFRS